MKTLHHIRNGKYEEQTKGIFRTIGKTFLILFLFFFAFFIGQNEMNKKWESVYGELSDDYKSLQDKMWLLQTQKLDAEWESAVCHAQFTSCRDLNGQPIFCRIIVERLV